MAALAVAAAVAFLLLGSGGSQIDGPIAKAATLSSGTPGYRVHMSIEMSASLLGAPMRITGNGIVDLRGQTSSMSLAMDLAGEPQLAQRLGSSTVRIEVLTDHAVVYLKLPAAAMAALPTGGRQWVRLDLAKLSHVPGLSALGSNSTLTDPGQTLDSLRSISDRITTLGQERLGRLRTTHYRAALSLRDFDKRFSQVDSTASTALSALQQNVLPSEVPVDVWIDSKGLVRRVQMTLDVNIPSSGSIHETVTADINHYGPQPAPAIPSDDEVFDLNGLAGHS